MGSDGETALPPAAPSWRNEAGAGATCTAAERETQLRLALEATGLSLWSFDAENGTITWSPPPGWLPAGPPTVAELGIFIDKVVHPDDRVQLRQAFTDLSRVPAEIEAEFRVTPDGGDLRWILARGAAVPTGHGPPRLTGILLDITERALARTEHRRLLHAERRAGRRATALQRVAAALCEAATTEQVAAVMVEESLRSLGVEAARIEVHRSEPLIGGTRGRSSAVTRSAGAAQLLSELPSLDPDGPVTVAAGASPPAPGTRSVMPTTPRFDTCDGRTRLSLPLDGRGRWTIAWLDGGDGLPSGDDRLPSGDQPTSLWSPQDWTSAEGLDLLHALAIECCQAIDRAELYEQQRDIATVLQRTLLPSVLPEITGAEIAARYQPGGRGVDVGGDWYDAISLPEGRIGLIIGDVEGHNATAAAVMGQVRNALRAYAVEGSTPSTVLERANRLLARLQVSQLVSCCYLEFAPSEGIATVALAGHPPPLLITPGTECDFVPAHANLMLGVDGSSHYIETTVLLDPGACLVLYTDGLVETIDRSLPDGLAALRGWVSGWDLDEPPDELLERIVRQAREGLPVLDDVAVLALAYRPLGRVRAHHHRTVRRTFPLDPASAGAARRFVADVLDHWQLGSIAQPATLMTSELVTNSVIHTGGELEVALSADSERLHVEVADHSERLPTLQAPDVEAPGGRGLLIIETLADRWGADPRRAGKAVWFEILTDAATPVP